MYWQLSTVEPVEDRAFEPDGRFVLHRHRDRDGAHFDLRLEQDGYLLGWRIDAADVVAGAWATEKPPHSTRWLECDGPAVREDAGLYAWAERSADARVLLIKGRTGTHRMTFRPVDGLRPREIWDIRAALAEIDAQPKQAAALIRDGAAARERAIARLCGLGRELDGSAFDETLWRKAVHHLSLDEIHAHLRPFELRFDERYPPQPVSRPERLPEEDGTRTGAAMAIARDEV